METIRSKSLASKKVARSAEQNQRPKPADSLRRIARKKNVPKETENHIVNAADQPIQETEELRQTAMETLLYALRKKRSGRLALDALNSLGVLKNSRRASLLEAEDRRTPEEILRDNKIRALTALMTIAHDRAEAYDSPIDLNNIQGHVIELHPVDEKKG